MSTVQMVGLLLMALAAAGVALVGWYIQRHSPKQHPEKRHHA